MTKEEYASQAAAWRGKLHNCCLAVMLGLADQTSADEKTLRTIGSGFAEGIGGTLDGSCGALSGAVAIAGLHREGEGTMRDARAIATRFIALCGATSCRDVKGVDTGKVLCSCEDCVKNAVLAYCEAMGIE